MNKNLVHVSLDTLFDYVILESTPYIRFENTRWMLLVDNEKKVDDMVINNRSIVLQNGERIARGNLAKILDIDENEENATCVAFISVKEPQDNLFESRIFTTPLKTIQKVKYVGIVPNENDQQQFLT